MQPIRQEHFEQNRKMKLVKAENLVKVTYIYISSKYLHIVSITIYFISFSQAVNRFRAKNRPPNPENLEFELNEDAIPDYFTVHDIWVGKGRRRTRHLILISVKQVIINISYLFIIHDFMKLPIILLQTCLLAKVRRLYMDGTFKVVKKPFIQLYSLLGFIRSGCELKMVPLAFILMSRRTRKDYQCILKTVKKHVVENKFEVNLIR